MILVVKFGGTSVGDGARIRRAAELVVWLQGQGHQVVVVTSAMSKVTDQLVALAEKAAPEHGGEETWLADSLPLVRKLERDHLEAAGQALYNGQLENVRAHIKDEIFQLERVLKGSQLLGEMPRSSFDFLVSEGERLCVPILTACLRELGLRAVGLGGDEAGILTDNNFGCARADEERTCQAVRENLLPLLEQGQIPVIAGFYGRSQRGRPAILGRGGSDYSATLIGAALDADQIWILTDVDGIHTGDPNLLERAHTVPEISYDVAAEMALLGAKILHGKCAAPAAQRHIPVRIANAFHPERRGTYLSHQSQPGVTALTSVRAAGLVQATSLEGVSEQFAVRIVEEKRRKNIDVILRTSGLNGATLMYLVDHLNLNRFVKVLHRLKDPQMKLHIRRDVAVVGVVGERLQEIPGLLTTINRCLDEAHAQPLVFVQGASPHSIVMAFPDQEENLRKLLTLLHRELGLDARATDWSEAKGVAVV